MHSISLGFTTLPNNCTHSPSGHITGLKAAARRDALTLGAGSPTPSRRQRRRGHYFLINDILIPPLPSITSPPHPLSFENLVLFAVPSLCQGPSTLIQSRSCPSRRHPSPPSFSCAPGLRLPGASIRSRAAFRCPRTPSALPTLTTLQAPCPTPNVFSAGLPGLEETHHSGGCYCHCSGC